MAVAYASNPSDNVRYAELASKTTEPLNIGMGSHYDEAKQGSVYFEESRQARQAEAVESV